MQLLKGPSKHLSNKDDIRPKPVIMRMLRLCLQFTVEYCFHILPLNKRAGRKVSIVQTFPIACFWCVESQQKLELELQIAVDCLTNCTAS